MTEHFIGEGKPRKAVFRSLRKFANEHPNAVFIARPKMDGLYILKVRE